MAEGTNKDETTGQQTTPLLRMLLWLGAFLIAGLAVFSHRWAGPTDSLHGRLEIGGSPQQYRLPLSTELLPDDPEGLRTAGTLVELRLEGEMPTISGAVLWRNHPSDDPFSAVALDESRHRVTTPGEGSQRWMELAAMLPARPPGERLEYYVALEADGREMRVPRGAESVILQYLGFVPREILIPHVVAMLLALAVGMRAGLGAIFDPATTRRYAWAALVLATLGGMTLGPFVQYYATGEYWRGFPNGDDWSHNATLTIWLAWLAACLVLGTSTSRVTRFGRALAVVAACVTIGLFPIPHGLSEILN